MPRRQRRERLSHQYQALQPHEFRLLELLPAATLKADISCRLQHQRIGSAPPYEALSYTWGDGESTCRIAVDGLRFWVRRNLLDALRRLRQSRTERIIWIDAICIDQDNTKEKNVQVPLMRDIYAGAEQVVVWLGEETSDTGTAIKFIPVLTQFARFDYPELWLWQLRKEDFLRGLSSLITLFIRQWWTRTWTIQEVSLASKVLVLCGSYKVDWSEIHSFAMAWMDISPPPVSELTHLQRTGLRTLGMFVSGYSEALFRLRQELQTSDTAPKMMKLSNLVVQGSLCHGSSRQDIRSLRRS